VLTGLQARLARQRVDALRVDRDRAVVELTGECDRALLLIGLRLELFAAAASYC